MQGKVVKISKIPAVHFRVIYWRGMEDRITACSACDNLESAESDEPHLERCPQWETCAAPYDDCATLQEARVTADSDAEACEIVKLDRRGEPERVVWQVTVDGFNLRAEGVL